MVIHTHSRVASTTATFKQCHWPNNGVTHSHVKFTVRKEARPQEYLKNNLKQETKGGERGRQWEKSKPTPSNFLCSKSIQNTCQTKSAFLSHFPLRITKEDRKAAKGGKAYCQTWQILTSAVRCYVLSTQWWCRMSVFQSYFPL